MILNAIATEKNQIDSVMPQCVVNMEHFVFRRAMKIILIFTFSIFFSVDNDLGWT